MKRRFSSRLMAATVERLRPIGLSHTEAQRFRRAEARDDVPVWPRKESFACCAATRDEMGRLCVGDCGPDCLRRAARRAS